MVVSTHSEEMIASAIENDAFLLLSMGDDGSTEGVHSIADRTIADTLLAKPPIERVIFVEDESAWYLTRALLDRGDPGLSRRTSLVWCTGVGDLTALRGKIPRPPTPEIRFAIAPDGDQRPHLSDKPMSRRWPLHFLPTESDPDALFRSLRGDIELLATSLGVDKGALKRKLESLQGVDDHDWVNELGLAYGRPHVLKVLATCWASLHPDEAQTFSRTVREAI